MTFNRMPLFVWMTLIVSFLLVFAFPSLTVGADSCCCFDRNFGTNFFKPAGGGDPLLWQHLFWFFGHPEVYILILPAIGIVSEVLPTFSRKPIFGYAFVAYSGVAIGFLGFTVWAHHMFATGMGPLINALFSAGSFLIGVPTGVKIFNWIATLWLGDHSAQDAAVLCGRLCGHVYHRRYQRRYAGLAADRCAADRHLLSSWRIFTMCCSAARSSACSRAPTTGSRR